MIFLKPKLVTRLYCVGFSLIVLMGVAFSVSVSTNAEGLTIVSLVSMILGIVIVVFSRWRQEKGEIPKDELSQQSKLLRFFRSVFIFFALIGAILGATGAVHDISMLNKVGANVPIFGLIGERLADSVKTKKGVGRAIGLQDVVVDGSRGGASNTAAE